MTETIFDRFRPSNMEKVMACPASAGREVGMPDPGSEAAAQGSVAHFVAAKRFQPDWNARTWLNQTIPWCDDRPGSQTWAIKVDGEMLDHIETYYRYVMSFCELGKPAIERRVDLTEFGLKSGTTDAAYAGPTVLHVWDLKYGRGVQVGADHNPQLSSYSLGLLRDWEYLFETANPEVWLHIYQPRGNGVSVYKTDSIALQVHFRIKLDDALKNATSDAPSVAPGDHCKFCRFKVDCPELAAWAAELPGMIDPKRAAPGLVDAAMMRVPAIRDWCNAIEERTKELIRNETPGMKFHKLVDGDGRRYWVDEDAVRARAQRRKLPIDDWAPRELRSVAQLEIQLGKKAFMKHGFPLLVEKKPGQPTLARVTDPRPAISTMMKPEDFPDLDDPLAF